MSKATLRAPKSSPGPVVETDVDPDVFDPSQVDEDAMTRIEMALDDALTQLPGGVEAFLSKKHPEFKALMEKAANGDGRSNRFEDVAPFDLKRLGRDGILKMAMLLDQEGHFPGTLGALA